MPARSKVNVAYCTDTREIMTVLLGWVSFTDDNTYNKMEEYWTFADLNMDWEPALEPY